MSEPLRAWSDRVGAEFRNVSVGAIRYGAFMRDPPRTTRIDPLAMLAPADGVILHAGLVEEGDLIEVKGAHHALAVLLAPYPVPDEPSVVVGIFMTFYDPHVNRLPCAGAVTWRHAEPIESTNRPMLFAEEDLLHDDIAAAYRSETYLRTNARTVNRVTARGLQYHLVQVADLDVDVIAPFASRQGAWFCQGQRFSLVRWGSQVELVVPARLVRDTIEVGQHVEAGVDWVVKLTEGIGNA